VAEIKIFFRTDLESKSNNCFYVSFFFFVAEAFARRLNVQFMRYV